MPVRTAINTSRRSVRALMACEETDSHESESSLEKDLYERLIFDRGYKVESFEEQPVKIDYVDQDGRPTIYHPDTLIYWTGQALLDNGCRPTLVEVKYRKDFWEDWPYAKYKYKQAIKYCAERHWKFKILTEVEIRTQYLENAKFLKPYLHSRNNKIDPDLLKSVKERVESFEAVTIDELFKSFHLTLEGRGHFFPVIWRLIAKREILIDYMRPLSMQTHMWMPSDKYRGMLR